MTTALFRLFLFHFLTNKDKLFSTGLCILFASALGTIYASIILEPITIKSSNKVYLALKFQGESETIRHIKGDSLQNNQTGLFLFTTRCI